MLTQNTPGGANQKFSVALPCSADDFKNFIGGLLGKPQSIQSSHTGAFEITKSDITNSYHLVTQRVAQQNNSTLIQFTVKLVFDDNSSVLINSLADFESYVEVRPVVVTQAHLSWSFLVQFQDRPHPERQEIDLSFITHAEGTIALSETDSSMSIPISKLLSGGHITYSIRHTARTWGADLESLLTGHANHILLPERPTRKFFRTHSGKVATALAFAFFTLTIAACLWNANHLAENQVKSIATLINSSNQTESKINTLLEMNAEGFWGKYFFSVFIFTIYSFIASIGIGVWAETTADTRRPSYILLTRKSEQHKAEQDKKYEAAWRSFILSVITGIATGVIGNIIFTKYWSA